MNKNANYPIKFYARRVTVSVSDGNAVVTAIDQDATDIEGSIYAPVSTTEPADSFIGYMECNGLLTLGKRKNAYTESYADSNVLRYHLGSNVTREATTVKLKFAFTGPHKLEVYNMFCNLIRNNVIEYHDTARNRYAYLLLIDSVDPSEDVWKGSESYVVCEFTMQNIFGETFTSSLITSN